MREEYRLHFERHRATIRRRLEEFRAVPVDNYLWELCYCLLTPGTRAIHAEQVVAELRERDFLARQFDPTPHLRDPRHYIRFHNQKAKRLLCLARNKDSVQSLLCDRSLSSREVRDALVERVPGLGWKEASHVLRNIGHRELAIIDRHVLKHLHACGVLDDIPDAIPSRRAYLELERRFHTLATSFGLSVEELDLLFWSYEEGSVRK